MSEKNFNVLGHPGTSFKARQLTSGRWLWEIRVWKEVVADGDNDTKELAQKAMEKAAGKVLLSAAKKRANKSNLYARLKEIARKRPFLSVFTYDAIVHDMELETIMQNAQEEEESRHARATEELGYPELKLHALAKPAKNVVETIWNTIAELGWNRDRVHRFAKDYLGNAYNDPEGATPIEWSPLKKKKKVVDE